MKLQEYRTRAGIDRATLAALVGVSKNALGNWERGERIPRPKYWPKIAAALGCSIDDLFGEGAAHAQN